MPEQVDVAVVGGGLAGLAAANRAAQLGLRPLVLEARTEERYPCNSRYTSGAFHVCFRDIMSDGDTLRGAIDDVTDSFADPRQARSVAEGAGGLVRWLQGEGIRFIKAGHEPYQHWALAPPRPNRPGLHWEGRAGDVMLRMLEGNLVARGGRLVRGARVRSLVMADGRCVGVETEREGKILAVGARAVVIADGGFQGNSEMLREMGVTGRPDRLFQRGAGTGEGDGLRMARAAGAAIVRSGAFYGHVLCQDVFGNAELWPWPWLDNMITAGIAVDSVGNRFADEGRGGVWMANAIARLDDPFSATVIFDEAIWQGPGRQKLVSPNPNLNHAGATIMSAGDLSALADKVGIPATSLIETVEGYNRALAEGAGDRLNVPRTQRRIQAWPIGRPPFYASRACAGITFTMDGIAIDGDGRVLGEDGASIQGLYAAGSTTGGLEGGPAIGYIGGLAKSGVIGLRAAEHIAASLPRDPQSSGRLVMPAN